MSDEPMTEQPISDEPILDEQLADVPSGDVSSGDVSSADPCAANPSDCKEAVAELYVFLDGELTIEKRASIGAHLDACSHCLDAYDFHAELKTVISEKCRSDLPTGLRDRVFDALRALDS